MEGKGTGALSSTEWLEGRGDTFPGLSQHSPHPRNPSDLGDCPVFNAGWTRELPECSWTLEYFLKMVGGVCPREASHPGMNVCASRT